MIEIPGSQLGQKDKKKPDGFHYLKAIRLRPVTILRIPIGEAGPVSCTPPLLFH